METIIFCIVDLICLALLVFIYHTQRKRLCAEIDALTEELANVAEQKSELFKKTEEQSATIAAQKQKIDMLSDDNKQYFGLNKSLERKVADLNKEVAQKCDKITELDAKYRAVVQYQQNTQEAYDELILKYDKLLAGYDASEVEHETAIRSCEAGCESKEYDDALPCAPAPAEPAKCDTAKAVEFKPAQERNKNGRFEKKHKRDDNPRK